MSLEDALTAWQQAIATQNTILVELSHRCQVIEAKLERNSQALEDARLTTLSGQFHALYDALCKKLDGMKNSLEAGNVRLSTIADGRDYLNSRYSDSHGKLKALEDLCNKLFVKLDALESKISTSKRKARK
jgi:chromosome segregation ATPase